MGATSSHPDDYTVAVDATQATPAPDGDAHPLSDSPNGPGTLQRELSSLDNFCTTEFSWNFGGHSVYVTGAWDNWNLKAALSRTSTPTDFTAALSLPLGTFQYKFIVDGNWKHNPALPTESDQNGNLNNVVIVSQRPPEYDSNTPPHEELPDSPLESYDYSLLPQEDHASEPPTLPLMLTSAPVDRFARPSATTTDFVRLNHIFETDSRHTYGNNVVRILATETRHKAKVVTTILIAPVTKAVVPHTMHTVQTRYRPSAPNSIPSHGESQTLILDALNNV